MSDGDEKDEAAVTPEAKEAPETKAESDAPEDDSLAPVDDDVDTDLPGATPDPVAELEEKLAQAKKEAASTKERMLRVAADFENFRRRSVRELDDTRQRAKMDAVKELLPVFDNLERATSHAEGADAQSVVDGIRMVIKQFIDTLGKLGMERIEAVGQPFDPNLHESIQFEHSEEHAAGIVINEFHAGYKQGDKLLRPTLVVVSRGPKPAEQAEGDAPAEASDDSSEPAGEDAQSASEGDGGGSAEATESDAD